MDYCTRSAMGTRRKSYDISHVKSLEIPHGTQASHGKWVEIPMGKL